MNYYMRICNILAIDIDDIMLPNETVPSESINPNFIIVELPFTNESFR